MAKILIIDDEVMNMKNMIQSFEGFDNDYHIFQANDGMMGFNIAKKIEPDIIISDWDMPTSGIELLKMVRSNERLCDTPVLIYSGIMTDKEDLAIALDAGANDYLNKPINPLELQARTQSMLRLGEHLKNIKRFNNNNKLLLSSLSHDLQSYIGTAHNSIELYCEEKDVLKEEVKLDLIESTRLGLEFSDRLLKDMLTWVRTQVDTAQLTKEEFNISDCVQEVIDELLWKYNEKQIHIRFEKLPHKTVLNKQSLCVIIRNILFNSYKFTPVGGDVSINLSKENLFYKLTICDNGLGIDYKTLEQIKLMIPVASNEGVNGEKGFGLGLVNSIHLANANNFKINFESTKSQGTSVEIFIPALI